MAKRRALGNSKRNYSELTVDEDSDENEENISIPNGNDSDSDGDSSSDDENTDSEIFSWSNGKQVYSADLENQLILSVAKQRDIAAISHVELFKLFFSSEIKNYIIEATQENSLQISVEELNTFVGIPLLSSVNIRNNQYEYWETDSLVNCTDMSSAMSRNRFKEIKSKIKYSKLTD